MAEVPLGPYPAQTTCPVCHAHITTVVKKVATVKTHLIAGCLCLLGFWICAPIVYCTDCGRGKAHYCPKCNAYIGAYKEM